MLACSVARRDPRHSGVDRGGTLVERLAADDVRVVGAGQDDERHSVRVAHLLPVVWQAP
jgi:hypothetical protein